MPIREYQCVACSHCLDNLEKLDATPLLECPACTANALIKVISSGAFVLKGEGFYKPSFTA